MLLVLSLWACTEVEISTSVPTSSTPVTVTGTTPTGETGDTGDTGPALPDCEVEARDGELRDCMELVVYCDASFENAPVIEACIDCFGGFEAYHGAWQDRIGPDPYDACEGVTLPPLPETCSAHLVGKPSPDVVPFVADAPGRVWTDGVVSCFWRAEQAYGGASALPRVVHDEVELAEQLICFDVADYSAEVVVPAGAVAAFGLPGRQALIYDGREHDWVGLYGTELVLDQGCRSVSGVPPLVDVEAVILDEPAGATIVSCSLGECPAEVRGAPVPP